MQSKVIFLLCMFFGTLCCGAQNEREQREKAQQQRDEKHQMQLRQNEVTVSAQVWGMTRMYPLLDGLFQDLAATQVASLTLSPNAANGTVVDALQQSFQLQLQYSQLAGIQNSAAAQAATANSTYQSDLVKQETTLMQNLTDAYNKVTQAQTDLNKLIANKGSDADVATATQTLKSANDNLTSVGNAITNFKNLAAPGTAPSQINLASAPTLPSLSSTTLPSGITSAATGTGAVPPSFPPTKQMDNQVNILWNRLAQLVGAMARPDSVDPDDPIFLVKFDTGIYPLNRNKQLLEVRYSIMCNDQEATNAEVIDLFPRNAALNIVEDKYKDTAYGFGAVLSWFGVGGSVAYNREHLKASQLLGQSSYITGIGIGKPQFGWLFGVALGDDTIAPGSRSTFALIRIPKSGCTSPNIKALSTTWVKPPTYHVQFPETTISKSWPLPSQSSPTNCAASCVQSVEYNRNEFDLTVGKPAPVTVRITLTRDMDQQQTVSVNGQLIQRVRDNFGRAISPLVSGSNGVLETSQMGVNTWVPTSSRKQNAGKLRTVLRSIECD